MKMHTHRVLSVTAWALLTFVAFATLSPYSLRPELTETEPILVVIIERVGAFGLLGLLFLASYPDRLRTVCLIVFGSAIALELAQTIVPDRDARFVDALEKIVGGGAGILLGITLGSVLTGADGTFSKIAQKLLRSSQKTVDSESRELLVGFLIWTLFAVAIVVFQNIGR
jgi:VanZ family protein